MAIDAVLSDRLRIAELHGDFVQQLKQGERKGLVRGREGGFVAILGTPSIAVAASAIADAAEKAADLARAEGNEQLAEQQLSLVMDALRNALEQLDKESITLESDDDPLFDATTERLSKQIR